MERMEQALLELGAKRPTAPGWRRRFLDAHRLDRADRDGRAVDPRGLEAAAARAEGAKSSKLAGAKSGAGPMTR